MTKAVFQKTLGGLRPTDDDGEAIMAGIKIGALVMVEVIKARNLQHHRLFMALVQKVFENQERYEIKEHMLTALKVALGHCDTIIAKDGNPAYIPKSISFAKMDQTAFNAFYNRAVDIVIRHWLPGVTSEELKNEVWDMVGGSIAAPPSADKADEETTG
ncbi:hypothetical protein LCGC14_0354970 [marine sediment metagenome]|uniref:Uncharacterized protein n=1 Tax=marine sediment metagenome TaxID=412755 RepID=A0A0F9TSJ8_9ZZZZ